MSIFFVTNVNRKIRIRKKINRKLNSKKNGRNPKKNNNNNDNEKTKHNSIQMLSSVIFFIFLFLDEQNSQTKLIYDSSFISYNNSDPRKLKGKSF